LKIKVDRLNIEDHHKALYEGDEGEEVFTETLIKYADEECEKVNLSSKLYLQIGANIYFYK